MRLSLFAGGLLYPELDRTTPLDSIESVADDLAALIRGRCPDGKAHLVGHSLGAKVVLQLLARHPARAASAVISSALVRPSPLVAMMNSHAPSKLSLWMLRSDWLARYQSETFEFPDSGMAEQYLAGLHAMATENLDMPIAAFASALFLPQGLDPVDCPVLVTAGSREARSMLGSADDIRNAIPGARLEILPGADHTYPWSKFGKTIVCWRPGCGNILRRRGAGCALADPSELRQHLVALTSLWQVQGVSSPGRHPDDAESQ